MKNDQREDSLIWTGKCHLEKPKFLSEARDPKFRWHTDAFCTSKFLCNWYYIVLIQISRRTAAEKLSHPSWPKSTILVIFRTFCNAYYFVVKLHLELCSVYVYTLTYRCTNCSLVYNDIPKKKGTKHQITSDSNNTMFTSSNTSTEYLPKVLLSDDLPTTSVKNGTPSRMSKSLLISPGFKKPIGVPVRRNQTYSTTNSSPKTSGHFSGVIFYSYYLLSSVSLNHWSLCYASKSFQMDPSPRSLIRNLTAESPITPPRGSNPNFTYVTPVSQRTYV